MDSFTRQCPQTTTYSTISGCTTPYYRACVHQIWAVQWRWFARVNALPNLLGKKSRKVAAATSGLSRRWLTLCITMESERRIVKQYKCHFCRACEKYKGKVMEDVKKSVLASFLCWPEDCKFSLGENAAFFGILQHEQRSCLLPDTLWLWAFKHAFRAGEFTVTAFHCEDWKYAPEVKAAKGLKWCRVKVKGVNNPAWTAQKVSRCRRPS